MDFTSKDIEEINTYIRFWLGDVDESVISDDTLNFIVQMVIDKDPNYTGCDVVYYSTTEVLRWLSRRQGTGADGGTGEITSTKEKVGDVEVTNTYDTGGNTSGSSGWEGILSDLLSNPDSIGCVVTNLKPKTSDVIIGGVSHKEYNRVKGNLDAKSGWEMSSPYRRYLTKNKTLIG